MNKVRPLAFIQGPSQVPLVIFLLLVLSFVVSVYWLQNVGHQQSQQNTLKLQELKRLQIEVNNLLEQEAFYHKYGELYQHLTDNDLLQQQDRVFWTDQLIRLKSRLNMPRFRFNFLPEKPLTPRILEYIKLPNTPFHFSRIKLDMRLQHELDLFRFFDALNRRVSPTYLVESCQLSLNNNVYRPVATFDLSQGNVSALCTLVVFHTHIVLQEPAIKGGESEKVNAIQSNS